MDKPYFLGIDIGTTSVKVIAFSAGGRVLAEQHGEYPMHHPEPDRSEQDPEEILRLLVVSVENILQLFERPPELISFSSAMHGLLLLDEQGIPLSPLLIWADNRAASIATCLHQEKKALDMYQRTGVPVHAMSPFCKIIWFRENQPELFARTSRFVGLKEYVFFHLFAVYVVDSSIAAATGLMHISDRQWDPAMLQQAGIRADQLSGIVPVDWIFHSPRLFPSLASVPWVIGGSDGAMANLGTFPERDQALVVSIGTSCAARVIVAGPVTDPDMRSFCYHLQDNRYLYGGAGNNGAVVLQWLREQFFVSELSLPDFLALAEKAVAGSEGLIFLPYLLGERAPLWNAASRGVLFGLTVNHNRNHIVRAAMEGVLFSVYAIGRIIQEKKEIREVFVTGGFARSEFWVQLLADIFQLPVLVSETIENAAWGAVLLGMRAIAYTPEKQERLPKAYWPQMANREVYQIRFAQFEQLYRLLLPAF